MRARVLTFALLAALPAHADVEVIAVCATTPTLASLVREVGGAHVSVTAFAKPAQDPHFVEARPSYVRLLNRADLLVLNGLELELGWLPVLVRGARNDRVRLGAPGYLDASAVIAPLQVPEGPIDRSLGDVHALGNPHYLLDPINGVLVAREIEARLSRLRPGLAAEFERRRADFERRAGNALVGEALAARYDVAKLARLAEHGRLRPFLESQGEGALLGGWLGRVADRFGVRVVADHDLWPYFARRFGLRVVGLLEPKPGVPPTTRHLSALVEQMRAERVGLILAAAYYDPSHARFVADATGARVASMAHEVGSREGADGYLGTVDYNVRAVGAGE